MKQIFGYIYQYFREVNKVVFGLCTLITAVLIYLNFCHNLEKRMIAWPLLRFTGHYLIFLFAFGISYLLYYWVEGKNYFTNRAFRFFLFVAPAIFSIKMSIDTHLNISSDDWVNTYWNKVFYWPIRVAIITFILFFFWKRFHPKDSFYGLTTTNLKWKPYLLMLLIMVPLIAAASTQPDFLNTYPKLNSVLPYPEHAQPLSWFYTLIYELSYGSDFFSIELFFRGFLVLGFLKFAGKDAILPMACFYCTIHFGKPLGECISSYFGGILLGVVTYHTRSIYGGLIVHVGIAWLMEIGGAIGHRV